MANPNQSRSSRKEWPRTWKPPYVPFPLSYHPPSGRLYKTIKCKRHYFGRIDNWQAALEKFQQESPYLYNGKSKPEQNGEGLLVKQLLNKYRSWQKQRVQLGEITHRHFGDCVRACDRIYDVFGGDRLVSDLCPDDFRRLKLRIAKKNKHVAMGSEISRTRSVFRWAYDEELIPTPIRFGKAFRRTPISVLRREEAKRDGTRMLERDEIRQILAHLKGDPQWTAFVLLGVANGLGQSDLGNLEFRHLDLDGGWLTYARPKSGIARRSKLWAETVTAIRQWLERRPAPRDEQYKDRVFLTKYRIPWYLDRAASPVSAEFRKLLLKLKLYRSGLGHYSLRRTTETIGCEVCDQAALDYLMGHADSSMAGRYRQRIGDDRLEKIGNRIRVWLLGDLIALAQPV